MDKTSTNVETSSTRDITGASVAVCGGAGFIGSHLVDYLIEVKKCKVVVLDNLVIGQKKWVNKKAKFVWCDITHSEGAIERIFRDNQVEYVFNYVAEPYIPVSFRRPLHVFDVNARGALIVMNAAADSGVKAILQVSSAEIYGKVDGKIKEDDKVTPHSTYGASKSAIDALVQVRWKEAKTPVIAMRQFNVVGERESHPYIIPEIIYQLDKNKDGVIKLGNNSFRDFQYAGDAVAMAVELLEKGQFGEVYNMGSEEGIQMYDLAKLIAEIMGKPITIEVDQARVRPWEIWHLQSDNSKLFSVIQSRPKVSLKEALKKTVDYYYSNGGWDFDL